MALLMSACQALLRRSTTWLYGIWFCLYYEMVLLWQMPIAWFTFWKSTWGTRMTPADLEEQERKQKAKLSDEPKVAGPAEQVALNEVVKEIAEKPAVTVKPEEAMTAMAATAVVTAGINVAAKEEPVSVVTEKPEYSVDSSAGELVGQEAKESVIPEIKSATDKAAAEEIDKIFFEVIIAPDYDVEALEVLGHKKNRIILVRKPLEMRSTQFRSMLNGVLVQERDLKNETADDCHFVTDKQATAEEINDMLFANKVVKQSKSNAIVLAKNGQLLASGVGQTSRVDALKQAIEKAKGFGFDLHGAVMASDAFFPFSDCVTLAADEGVTAIIQPGGSIRDQESVDVCNQRGVAMAMTGFRHFKH